MTKLEAASTLIEMYGELCQYQEKHGNSTTPEFAEAVATACMALKEESDDC